MAFDTACHVRATGPAEPAVGEHPAWSGAKSEVPTITDASGARVRDDDRILDAMCERAQRVPYVSPPLLVDEAVEALAGGIEAVSY